MTQFYQMIGKKLLVADDSLTIQKVIRLALSNEGYEIHAVSDGNDALQQISLFQPNVVLIDVSLPGKSAFEVKREINQTDDFSQVRFILMSSAFEKVDESQAEEVGFQARLTKPFDPAHLRQILSEVLQDSSMNSAANPPQFEESLLPETPSHSAVDSAEDSLDDYGEFSIQEPLREDFSEELPSLPSSADAGLPPLPTVEIQNISDLWESEGRDIKHLADATLRPDFKPELSQETTWNLEDAVFPPESRPFEQEIRVGEKRPPTPPAPPTLQVTQPQFTPPQFTPPPVPQFTPPPMPQFSPPPPPISSPPPIPHQSPAFSAVSSDELEKMIQSQVQASLEKMARGLLPSIAERLIKEEIHRLLSEPEGS